jgi:hypothetical protein
MSALFNFNALLIVILLVICSCTYIHALQPRLLDRNRSGFFGVFWKAARIGERLSPYVSLSCIAMGLSVLISK